MKVFYNRTDPLISQTYEYTREQYAMTNQFLSNAAFMYRYSKNSSSGSYQMLVALDVR